jgi:hypothetical protein
MKVSLTYFVDFVLKAGTPKLTVVRNFKNNGEYDPAADFYKKIRDGIVDFHEKNQPSSALDKLLEGVTDEKKRTAYPAILTGHKKFMGKKSMTWFSPPSAQWSAGGLTVSLNPELGLEIGAAKTVLKLYFKEDKLEKRRAEIIAHLMMRALGANTPQTTFGVLDVRRGKVIEPPTPIAGHDALLTGEATSFAVMYNSL